MTNDQFATLAQMIKGAHLDIETRLGIATVGLQ